MIEALAGIVDADVYAELNDWVREDVIDEMEPQQVADLAAQLDTDDAVALIEDLDQDDQLAILRAMEPDDRAAVEEALTYGEETAGRLMQRDLIAVPEHWNVGQVIDYMRKTDELATDFWEVFVVAPNHHPVGTCKLSTILRSPRSVPIGEIMVRKQTLIPVDMDQEEVALKFQKYALISAAVVDSSGRLVGMITVDDIVHIIQEEAGEDVLLLSGAGEGDINEPVFDTYRARVRWLAANLLTALVASLVISRFESSIERMAVLAALMPIVAGVGGNAGTHAGGDGARHRDQPADRFQPLARRLARNPGRADERPDHRRADRHRRNGRARLGRIGRRDRRGNADQHCHRRPRRRPGAAGLERAGADPAVASSVFVTMVTDSMGFLVFLGLATAAGLAG